MGSEMCIRDRIKLMEDDIEKLKNERKDHDKKKKEELELKIIGMDEADILERDDDTEKSSKKGIKEIIESVKVEEDNIAVVTVDKVLDTGETFLDRALGLKNWVEEKVYAHLCCPFSCLKSEKKMQIKNIDKKFVEPMRELLNILDNKSNWNLVEGPGDR